MKRGDQVEFTRRNGKLVRATVAAAPEHGWVLLKGVPGHVGTGAKPVHLCRELGTPEELVS